MLAAKTHPEPGEPALGAPGARQPQAGTCSISGGVWIPTFSPAREGVAPITLFQREISLSGDGETEARSQKEASFLLSLGSV